MAKLVAVIRAAGGVVWRHSPTGGREICLVHRPRHDDWSLPKGKLFPGESPLAGALREVSEETAVQAVPRLRLPRVYYDAADGPKMVDYWGMYAQSAPPFTPNSEVDQVAWAPESAAPDQVRYPHDAKLLRQFTAMPEVTGVVLLVRHAPAVARRRWEGADKARPLTEAGEATATALSRLLALYQPTQLFSASPERCRQTLAGLSAAMDQPVRVDEAFDAARADLAAATDRIREHARARETAVVCSQGELIPEVLARLTGTAPDAWPTAKGDGWLLPFSGAAPLPPTPLA